MLRRVTATILRPDGTPYRVGTPVVFTLVSFSFDGTAIRPIANVTATLDALSRLTYEGALGVPLWPNELGDLASAYQVKFPDGTSKIFVLPADEEDIELQVLLEAGITESDQQYQTLLTYLLDWLQEHGVAGPTGQGVPIGGLAGQFLAKVTSASYDTVWRTLQTADVEHLDEILLALASPATGQDTYLLSGGMVTWIEGYTFRLHAGAGFIRGTYVSWPEQQVTLTAANAFDDRIDVIAVAISGAAVVVTGDPAPNPAEPVIDPDVYLRITFIPVTTNTTEPTDLITTPIYLENTEWATQTNNSIQIKLASSAQPLAGSVSIEAIGASGSHARFFAPVPFVPAIGTNLLLPIRSKASWGDGRFNIAWWYGSTRQGLAVQIRDGLRGFNSSDTSGYQHLAIPLSAFQLPAGQQVGELRIGIPSGFQPIGFSLDNIALQSGLQPPEHPVSHQDIANAIAVLKAEADPFPIYLTETEGDARYAEIGHEHEIDDVDGLQAALEAAGGTPSWESIADKPNEFPPEEHDHEINDVNGLQGALDGKAASAHTHPVSDVTNLQTTLDGKAAASHSHTIENVTGLQSALDGKLLYERFISFSFTDNGDAYWVVPVAMTLALGSVMEGGTGTLAFAKALAADTTSFSGVSGNTSFAQGDVLRVTVTGFATYKAITVERIA